MSDRPLELSFVKSAVDHTTFDDLGPEVAFVGRSNVGKSSIINALANRKGLAHVIELTGWGAIAGDKLRPRVRRRRRFRGQHPGHQVPSGCNVENKSQG